MTEPVRRVTAASLLRFTILAAMAVVVFVAVATTSADVDLWGHVLFGLDFLDHGRLDARDPYSFTTDRPWINHEWLSELTFGAAWRAAGTPGLIAVKLATMAGALWFVRRTLMLRGVGGEVRLILLGLVVAGVLPRLVHVRPQLFSVLLFSMLVWVFARAEAGRRSSLALCPVLLALWTNFHGGWITGLGALGLWALGDMWDRRREGVRALDGAGWTAASAAATLLNPYGTGLWMFLSRTVRFGREGIGEWGPVWTQPSSIAVWLLFSLMVVAAVRSTGARHLGTRLIQPVFWGLASLKVVRLDAFFVLSVAGFLGPSVERFLGRRKPSRPALPLAVRGAIVAAVLAAALAVAPARRSLTCIAMYPEWWPEPAAIEFIRANGLSGRMLTFFNWGEYGIWHLPPSVKISMDGRRETVYSDEMFSRHLQFYGGLDEGVSHVESLGADYAWLPGQVPGVTALRARGWHEIFRGEQSVILSSRAGESESFTEPQSSRSAVPRCFPGP